MDDASKRGLQTGAIESLSQAFDSAKDSSSKQMAASSLVKLRADNPKYWDYLDQLSSAVLDLNRDIPLTFDANGSLAETPALKDWARSKHVDAKEMMPNLAYTWPSVILSMGMTDDLRAIPILRRALESKNISIQMAAAEGLAELQDEGAVPEIIAASRRASTDAAIEIATNLVYFKNSRLAQAAAEMYLPADRLRILRERAQLAKGPLSK